MFLLAPVLRLLPTAPEHLHSGQALGPTQHLRADAFLFSEKKAHFSLVIEPPFPKVAACLMRHEIEGVYPKGQKG